MGMTSADAASLLLVSRHDCHLCDEMQAVLDEVLPRWGLDYRLVDVDADPRLLALYDECVPVLLWDGSEVARLRTSQRRLEKILRRRLGSPERRPG